jgi:hypothetical protein
MRWFGCLICWLAFVQKLLFFLLLLFLSGTLWIERLHLAFLDWRELGQVPYEHDELPAIVVFPFRAPGRHTGKPNAIVDDVVDLAVREILRVGQTHVRRFRVEVLADLRPSASVIVMADGAMIGEVSPRFAENFGSRREGIRRVRSDAGTESLCAVLAAKVSSTDGLSRALKPRRMGRRERFLMCSPLLGARAYLEWNVHFPYGLVGSSSCDGASRPPLNRKDWSSTRLGSTSQAAKISPPTWFSADGPGGYKAAERPFRLIHFKGDVLQLSFSLNLQNHRVTGLESTHGCPQLLDGIHGSGI